MASYLIEVDIPSDQGDACSWDWSRLFPYGRVKNVKEKPLGASFPLQPHRARFLFVRPEISEKTPMAVEVLVDSVGRPDKESAALLFLRALRVEPVLISFEEVSDYDSIKDAVHRRAEAPQGIDPSWHAVSGGLSSIERYINGIGSVRQMQDEEEEEFEDAVIAAAYFSAEQHERATAAFNHHHRRVVEDLRPEDDDEYVPF